MKKKILIIGSSGFIGSNLIEFFNASIRLKEKFILIKSHNHKKKRKLNFYSKINLFKFIILHNPFLIINLTGQIKKKKINEKKNIQANKFLIDICNKKKIKVIMMSTDHVFNNGNKTNFNSTIPNPKSNYGKLKFRIEKLYKRYSNDFKILRPSNVYDNNFQKVGLLKNLKDSYIKKQIFIFDNIKIFRNFIHVNDLVAIIFIIISKFDVSPQILNISHENFKLSKILSLFKIKFKYDLKILNLNKKNQKNIIMSNMHIVKELNYKYKHTLSKTVQKL